MVILRGWAFLMSELTPVVVPHVHPRLCFGLQKCAVVPNRKVGPRKPHLDNHFTEMCSGAEAGSYLRPIDSCITQLKAQGPSMTCDESKHAKKKTS